MIVKTFIGKHIDLSKVVAISDAYFIDRMGSGGYYVGFEIDCQLLDKPIKYIRELDRYNEQKFENITKVKLVNGEYMKPHWGLSPEEEKEILAVARLQEQIDDLVEQWKASKGD